MRGNQQCRRISIQALSGRCLISSYFYNRGSYPGAGVVQSGFYQLTYFVQPLGVDQPVASPELRNLETFQP